MFRLNSRTCQIELIVHVGEYGGTLELGGEEGVTNEAIDLGDTYDVVESLISEALRFKELRVLVMLVRVILLMQMVVYGISLDANGLSFGIDIVGVDMHQLLYNDY
ncbi:hypothetical protein RHMOL_Rhmol03G0115400 [Rhododendron molle]|uniref:Uncharacterized protein n=1 Tax=Rhododendron molle TaxID=49168 RepID=A0ACC0PFL0_RHOML|nr:hypothetical protein RHMOL_Rhmol03G0115400 [Rhododendron molle]